MKKTILSALIAATALAPVMASAQDWQGRRGDRGGNGAQARPERPARADRPQGTPGFDRDAFRAQRQAERAARPSIQADADANAFRAQRGGDGSAQLRAQPNFDREAFRAQREARRAAESAPQGQAAPGWYGNPPQQRQDRREFRQERRDDRQDFRQERREDRRDLNAGRVTPQEWRQDRRDDRQDFRRDRRDDVRDYRRDQNRGAWNGGNNWNRGDGWNRGSNWNRQWRNDRRYDWQGWRGQNRNAYRLPRYYAPRGYNYGYQRFGIGVTLGSLLFQRNYWISDPWQYRLPPAYGPYQWVRYYNDALLVDIETGEVVDVINDIFW